MQQLHFIAGLPRSGSTMLSALLRQNPSIHASVTSPLASLCDRLTQAMSARSDYAGMLTEEKRASILRAIFFGYYVNVSRPIVFDTNRAWCARLALLEVLFPGSRVICCVRDPAWVIDSFERLYQSNPLILSKMFTPEQAATVHTRVEALGSVSGVVGYAYDAFAEAYYGGLRHKLAVLDYDEFCAQPQRMLGMLYDGLGLPAYEHRLDALEMPDGEEFDARFGLPGLHRIRGKVERLERRTILPPELFARFSGRAFWRNGP